MRRISLFLSVAIFFAPAAAGAQVVINEVAWMGTLPKDGETPAAAANNEWIELYNGSGNNVSLEGWRIISADGNPDIPLAGTVAAGGYFLLERTNDDTVSGIPADLIYPYNTSKSSLSNSGEYLYLKDVSGVIADEINGTSQWPAGDNDTKETMQRSGAGWITAPATPRAPNAGAATAASGSTASGSSSGAASSGSTVSGSAAANLAIYVFAGEDIKIDAGSVATFFGTATDSQGATLDNARYFWDFGDGVQAEGRRVTHAYAMPGKYTAGVHAAWGGVSASDYRTVEVLKNQPAPAIVLPEAGTPLPSAPAPIASESVAPPAPATLKEEKGAAPARPSAVAASEEIPASAGEFSVAPPAADSLAAVAPVAPAPTRSGSLPFFAAAAALSLAAAIGFLALRIFSKI